MTMKVKLAAILALILWASAFVGIRAGLQGYTPEGLALLRYFVASFCMALIYMRLPRSRPYILIRDRAMMFLLGAVGIGFYNLALNYGELTVTSGTASFIISQTPVIIAVIAILFLGESFGLYSVMGFVVSMLGVLLIGIGEVGGWQWNKGFAYIFLATLAGSFFTVLQKPFLKKYHPIEATIYVVWGGTIFLLWYFPNLKVDWQHASLQATFAAIYLGIFPAAVGYVAWSYVLSVIPASRAGSLLYLTPFIAMLLGWGCLGEVPALLTIAGGLLAIVGVYLINRSYQQPKLQEMPVMAVISD